MSVSPEDSTLTARLIDLATDITNELNEEAKTLRQLAKQKYEDEDPLTWMFMVGKHCGRQDALTALSAFIITQADDLQGSLEPYLAELPDNES